MKLFNMVVTIDNDIEKMKSLYCNEDNRININIIERHLQLSTVDLIEFLTNEERYLFCKEDGAFFVILTN